MSCLRLPGSLPLQHALATGTRLGLAANAPGGVAAAAAAGPGVPLARTPQQQAQLHADLTMGDAAGGGGSAGGGSGGSVVEDQLMLANKYQVVFDRR